MKKRRARAHLGRRVAVVAVKLCGCVRSRVRDGGERKAARVRGADGKGRAVRNARREHTRAAFLGAGRTRARRPTSRSTPRRQRRRARVAMKGPCCANPAGRMGARGGCGARRSACHGEVFTRASRRRCRAARRDRRDRVETERRHSTRRRTVTRRRDDTSTHGDAPSSRPKKKKKPKHPRAPRARLQRPTMAASTAPSPATREGFLALYDELRDELLSELPVRRRARGRGAPRFARDNGPTATRAACFYFNESATLLTWSGRLSPPPAGFWHGRVRRCALPRAARLQHSRRQAEPRPLRRAHVR
jgi:hypothetical protein